MHHHSKPRPTSFGLALYPGFEVLDVFGPLEALNTFSRPEFRSQYANFSLSVLSTSLDPVSAMPANRFNQSVVPTHTFADAPRLDVLLVPGGLGSDKQEKTQPVVDFIREQYPNLQYLITVCTGADLAARAGVLDGKRATTNKAAWKEITQKPTSSKTYWVANARWVVDGNIWTTSGVSAGIDAINQDQDVPPKDKKNDI
ncbi:hypothetical protein CNMCM5623_007835 [Aspergillus felis]|uniref:DJ-1/PfpI domain-containing protein n=1 Tax=Aspergillus felis TaxID=1287682 RepID=A0A8H6V1Q4_9EURO|nr:hypothetical protein CNMCM5623_007835 [Aspergillus felis]KAF7174792.1 hypothetical protein CNMCM7691_003478 [Aspergillus felis]